MGSTFFRVKSRDPSTETGSKLETIKFTFQMNNQNNETSYKVLILGNQGTGKTAIANAVSLVEKFSQDIFYE